MEIDRTIFSTRQLLGVLRELEPLSTYWSDSFANVHQSTNEWIEFDKITNHRKIAPFVVPTHQGEPIYSANERVFRFKPAYSKMLDAVDNTRMVQRRAGLGELLLDNPQTPQQRYNAVVSDIMREHDEAARRLWEFMAAEAMLYGKITIVGENYPKTIVDFERDPDFTRVKAPGAQWGDPGVSIKQDVENWRHMMRRAKFGGQSNRLTVTPSVWQVMQQDDGLREEMNLNYRSAQNNGMNLQTGIREGADVEYVGNLSGSLRVFVYNDYYTDEEGAPVSFMKDGDVLLDGPGLNGHTCFASIRDKAASWNPLPMFPKMYDEENPSATFCLTQTAPLMLPVNPNNTLLASVVTPPEE